MESIYIFIVGAIVLLAISDLIVGVSNDAVNFLNSANGSKVISFRNIMILASIIIFLNDITLDPIAEFRKFTASLLTPTIKSLTAKKIIIPNINI